MRITFQPYTTAMLQRNKTKDAENMRASRSPQVTAGVAIALSGLSVDGTHVGATGLSGRENNIAISSPYPPGATQFLPPISLEKVEQGRWLRNLSDSSTPSRQLREAAPSMHRRNSTAPKVAPPTTATTPSLRAPCHGHF